MRSSETGWLRARTVAGQLALMSMSMSSTSVAPSGTSTAKMSPSALTSMAKARSGQLMASLCQVRDDSKVAAGPEVELESRWSNTLGMSNCPLHQLMPFAKL